MTDVFVRTTADSGGDGTTNTDSSGGGTHAYNTLDNAEGGEQADITSGNILDFLTHGGADSARAIFGAGWVVDSTHYITVTPQAADRHTGKIDTAKYHQSTDNSYRYGIRCDLDYSIIDALQVLLNHQACTGVEFDGCIDVVAKNCIIQGDDTSTIQNGITHDSGVTTAQFSVINNVIYDCVGTGIEHRQYDADLTAVYYNNTVNNCGTGINIRSVHASNTSIYNNICTNNTTDYSLSGSYNSDNNLSSDATSPQTAHRSKTVTYTDAAGGDFSTSDVDVVTLGTDLTSDSLFPFSTDIIGEDRATSWDLGAFQDAVSAISLVVQDITQGQTIDNSVLIQDHLLVSTDINQAQAIDNSTLSTGATVSPADIDQGQTIDNAVLVQHNVLATDDATQAQTVDNSALVQQNILVLNDVDQGQTIGNSALVQHYVLAVNGLDQAQTIDNTTLTQAHILAVDGLDQAQTIDNVTLAVQGLLAVQDVDQLQIIDNSTLVVQGVLSVQDIDQGQSIDILTLVQNHILAVQDLTQAQILDNCVLVAGGVPLVVQDVNQGHTIDNSAMVQHNALLVDELTQSQILDVVNFGGIVVGYHEGVISIYSAYNGTVDLN